MLLNLWNNRSRQQQIFLFFALTLVLRILFSVSVGLIDDEAYHWSWTRDLQWSYFDHPGMIAWLEYISTQFFGDTIIAVRLPSFICYIFSVILAWKLAEELFDRWTAHFTALMILWTPFWGFGGYVASPETPFILCWLWASLVFWRSVRPDNPWSLKKSWIYLGLIMGLGLNSKFIIALLAPGFALYLLMSPEHRKSLLKPWPWVGFLLATALCSPIFFWNLWHDWPGFRYQFHDRHTGSELSLTRWLQFIAAQVLFFTPVLYFLILVSAVVSALRIKEPRWRFLFCLSFPSF
ncbi:MAG: glycosyltransferase family 39 protein, partial [Pseudobdellovibrionaceae bacterium]